MFYPSQPFKLKNLIALTILREGYVLQLFILQYPQPSLLGLNVPFKILLSPTLYSSLKRSCFTHSSPIHNILVFYYFSLIHPLSLNAYKLNPCSGESHHEPLIETGYNWETHTLDSGDRRRKQNMPDTLTPRTMKGSDVYYYLKKKKEKKTEDASACNMDEEDEQK